MIRFRGVSLAWQKHHGGVCVFSPFPEQQSVERHLGVCVFMQYFFFIHPGGHAGPHLTF